MGFKTVKEMLSKIGQKEPKLHRDYRQTIRQSREIKRQTDLMASLVANFFFQTCGNVDSGKNDYFFEYLKLTKNFCKTKIGN